MSVNIKVTGGLNIEWGQIDPMVTGGLSFQPAHHDLHVNKEQADQLSSNNILQYRMKSMHMKGVLSKVSSYPFVYSSAIQE